MTESSRHDVAVVGGGLAGSTVAALLARAGRDVVVIEKESFPRDKLCGEFLSWDADPILDLLGLEEPIGNSESPRIDRCRFYSEDRTFEFDLPSSARGVSRLALDDSLASSAVSAGAKLLTRRVVTRIEPSAPEPFVLVRHGEDTERIAADQVIGAWGRWGKIDQQLRRKWVSERRNRYFGFKRHYLAGGPPSRSIDIHVFRDGYLGISPVEDDTINVCGLVHESRMKKMRSRWHGLVEEIREESFSFAERMKTLEPRQPEFLSSEPVIFRARRPIHDHAILIGDSAGIVDPLAGNGMAMALQSALLAVVSILRHRERSARIREYQERFAKMFHPRIRWSRAIAALLGHPQWIGLATRVAPSSVGTILAAKTRGDLPTVESLVLEYEELVGRQS